MIIFSVLMLLVTPRFSLAAPGSKCIFALCLWAKSPPYTFIYVCDILGIFLKCFVAVISLHKYFSPLITSHKYMHRLKIKLTVLKLMIFFDDPGDDFASWLWNLEFFSMWERSAVYICVVCALHKGAWVKGESRELKYTLCSTREVYEYLPRRDALC